VCVWCGGYILNTKS